LAPPDLRKEGAAYDLPIALGILAATGALPARSHADIVVVGALSLDGEVRPTSGVLPVAIAAARGGIASALRPCGQRRRGGRRLRSGRLARRDIVRRRGGAQRSARPLLPDRAERRRRSSSAPCGDFADIRGQMMARRALEVAAAGGHHVLLSGPPGSGKTMMARSLAGILPPLTTEEALEVTSIHSVAGLLPDGAGLMTARPFRAPHHTISDVALVGGGVHPRPGELSLAHAGVLFLDEMPEFERGHSRCSGNRSRRGVCGSREPRRRWSSPRASHWSVP